MNNLGPQTAGVAIGTSAEWPLIDLEYTAFRPSINLP